MSLAEFYENHFLVDGKKPVVDEHTKKLLEALEKGELKRVYTRKHGYQWVIVSK